MIIIRRKVLRAKDVRRQNPGVGALLSPPVCVALCGAARSWVVVVGAGAGRSAYDARR